MKHKLKKPLFEVIGTIIFSVLLFCLFNKYYNDQPKMVQIVMEMKSSEVESYQVFYDIEGKEKWNEGQCVNKTYSEINSFDKLSFNVPINSKNIRIDFGNAKKSVQIKNMYFKKNGKEYLDVTKINEYISDSNNVKILSKNENGIIKVNGDDPYIVISDFNNTTKNIAGDNQYIKILLGLLAIVTGFVVYNALLELKAVYRFIKISLNNMDLIKSLSKNDFKSRYASSYLGIVWGFIHPLITICVYWFVFQVGFRSTDVGNVPFILWFIAGIIPWFYFSEALPSSSNSLLEYSYLVKKVVFKIEVLPTVKVISSLFVHLFFIVFIYAIMIAYGMYPSLCSLQFIYYSAAMVALVFAISIFTSCVILFFRDLGQIIGIIINVGFWATPIGWQLGMLPSSVARLFKLNPMYYIVTGYRDSFIDKIYIWQRPYETLYFWAFCIVVICIGVKMFRKLKPHFSDVI